MDFEQPHPPPDSTMNQYSARPVVERAKSEAIQHQSNPPGKLLCSKYIGAMQRMAMTYPVHAFNNWRFVDE